MMERLMGSPIPIPFCLVVKKASKMRSGCCSPMPPSSTSTRMASRSKPAASGARDGSEIALVYDFGGGQRQEGGYPEEGSGT